MNLDAQNLLVDVIHLSKELCAIPIQGELAYATKENFLGRVVKGYHPNAKQRCLLAHNTARKLCGVQNLLLKKHLGLFIFDGYRPLRAVRDFSEWMQQPPVDDYELLRKQIHYPRLEKSQLSKLGYIAEKVSNHCYGTTIDLTLMDLKTQNFLDMGASFDYFDEIAHSTATVDLIGHTAYHNRQTLFHAMNEFGFIPHPKEYWHFDHPERETDVPMDIEITAY